jgi:hypothetical protein
MTLDQVKQDLNALYSDTSVSRETTRDRLIELREEIDVLLDTLTEDEEFE